MDNLTNSTKDLSESQDKFITAIYKEIAKKVWKSHLRPAKYDDDIIKGIDYYSVAGSIQFKELKSDETRYCFNLESWPFETEAKNKYGKSQSGWIYHTEADYLIFIRTIRPTGEWKAFIFDWNKMRPYIFENINNSKANRFGSAKNQMFSKYQLRDYLIGELNN
jgi:hypothetical protein